MSAAHLMEITNNYLEGKMNHKNVNKLVFTIFCIIVSILSAVILAFFFLKTIIDESTASKILTAESIVSGLFGLFLTIYSTHILFIEIRNGAFCTKRAIRRALSDLSEKIKIYNPSFILFIQGNSEKLYNQYLKHFISPLKGEICLHANYRYGNPPEPPFIITEKHFIGVSELSRIKANDRIVIFDDVTKTGKTISALKKRLLEVEKIPEENILTCGFITDQDGFAHCGEPGFYCKKARLRDDYKFPWRNV